MELPHVEAFYRELKSQGFGLLTVTSDAATEVLKMVDYNGITHPIVSDNKTATGQVFERYHAYDGKHYLISSDGKILAAFSKLGISIPILERELAKYGIKRATTKISGTVPSAVPGLKAATAQPKPPPVVWSAPATPVAGTTGAKLSINLAISVAPGWYIYAIAQRPGGPTPLEITVPANQPFKLAGTIVEPKPEVKFDPGFGMEVLQIKANGQFVLPVAVVKAPPGKRTLVVEARYQACNSTICLPAKTDRIEVPVLLK